MAKLSFYFSHHVRQQYYNTKVLHKYFPKNTIVIPKKGYIMVLYYYIMQKIEIDNVKAMFEKEVDNMGRVSGLKKWGGRKVVIIVTDKYE